MTHICVIEMDQPIRRQANTWTNDDYWLDPKVQISAVYDIL